jgi:hypothetical protein
MTRPALRSLVLVLFAAPLVVVACGGGSGVHDAKPPVSDSSPGAADLANAANLDGNLDFATSTPIDGPVITPDALVDGRIVALDGPGVTPDVPGATPDAPGVSSDAPGVSSDSLVDRGAPDAPGAAPDAPVDADAADTGSDATVDGDAGNSGIQPRVLIIDPATDKFLTYDRDGQTVHDYHSALDFGAGYEKRGIRQETISVAWDATATVYYNNDFPDPLPGLDEPLRPSRIVVVAASTSGLGARAKIISMDGSVVADRAVPADHMDVRVSPAQKFLYAAQHVGSLYWCSAGTHAIVARMTDGTTVWQGTLCDTAFARDDSHLAFSPTNGCLDPPIHIVDLATGQETPAASPSFCDAGVVSANVLGASTLGVVFGKTGSSVPWFVDWQAKASPFAPSLSPSMIDTYVVRFNPQGSGVLWGGPTRQEFNLASLTSQPWSGPDDNCYGQPDHAFVKLEGQALRYCRCSDGTCALIATLAAPADAGWKPAAQLSPDGRFVFVNYSWSFDRAPVAGQDRLLYRSTGELLFSAAARYTGQILFDQTGQLAVLRSQLSRGGASELAIINLSNGQSTTLPVPRSYTIVYE